MQTLRQIALGVCLLCAAAGMIRIFWPENRFKPVINTVLLLYILTSVLQTGARADWNAVASEIGSFALPETSAADLSSYKEDLARQVSTQALADLLQQEGISAELTWREDILHVVLQHVEDLSAAETLLEENSGTLPYVIETEGGG